MAVFSKLSLLSRTARLFTSKAHNSTFVYTKDLARSLGNIPENAATPVWHYFCILIVPILAATYYNAFVLHHHQKRPDFVPYPHLRLRKKPFPWGDGNHGFLHDPYFNALPQGYETDDDGNPLPAGTFWQGNYTMEEGYEE